MAEQDLTRLSSDMYKNWEKAVGDWWDKVLESPTFLGAMGDSVSSQSKLRKTWEDQSNQAMAAMHLPSRSDVVRLARISGMLEEKLLGLEDRLLALDDKLVALDAKVGGIEKEALRARVDSAETRISLSEKLASLEEKIEALTVAINGTEPSRNARKGRNAAE